MMAAFYVAIPCCVVERKGPLQSLSRSAELTKGHRWKVFGIFILITICSAVIGPVIRVLFAAVGGVMVGLTAYIIWSILYTAYYLIVATVMYNDLRVAKEGIDTDGIAAVFD